MEITNEQAIEIIKKYDALGCGYCHQGGKEIEEAFNVAIKALQEQADRNEFYNWDAPIRHKADGEYISRKALLEDLYKRDYTKFTHRDFVALVQYQDIVAIPSAEPSRDMEEIEEIINCDADAETKCKMISNILTAKPHYFEKQEPAYCDRNICIKNEYNGIGCDECEVTKSQEPTCDTCEYNSAAFNPCNACKDKSEYEPQERSK